MCIRDSITALRSDTLHNRLTVVYCRLLETQRHTLSTIVHAWPAQLKCHDWDMNVDAYDFTAHVRPLINKYRQSSALELARCVAGTIKITTHVNAVAVFSAFRYLIDYVKTSSIALSHREWFCLSSRLHPDPLGQLTPNNSWFGKGPGTRKGGKKKRFRE